MGRGRILGPGQNSIFAISDEFHPSIITRCECTLGLHRSARETLRSSTRQIDTDLLEMAPSEPFGLPQLNGACFLPLSIFYSS